VRYIVFSIFLGITLLSFACGRSNRVIDRETYTIYLALKDTVQKLQVYGYARLRFFRIAESALSKGIDTTRAKVAVVPNVSLRDSLFDTFGASSRDFEFFDHNL
jgi:hypothetical protein